MTKADHKTLLGVVGYLGDLGAPTKVAVLQKIMDERTDALEVCKALVAWWKESQGREDMENLVKLAKAIIKEAGP